MSEPSYDQPETVSSGVLDPDDVSGLDPMEVVESGEEPTGCPPDDHDDDCADGAVA